MNSSAKTQQRLRATINVQPRLVLDAVLLPGHFGQDSMAVTNATVGLLKSYLAAPSARPVDSISLAQTADPRWDGRSLESLWPCDRFVGALLLSARSNWALTERAVEVVGTAMILDGARRVAAATANCESQQVPVVVYFGLNEQQELEVRRGSESEVRFPSQPAARLGTNTPRLEASESWVTATIESDPFVVPTARGYAPAVLVRRPRGAQAEHLLVGAKTLAEKLEQLRTSATNKGTLVGTTVRFRKQSAAKTSQYLLEVVS